MAREAPKAGGVRWRLWLGLAAAVAVCAASAMGALQVRQYAQTDPRFVFSRERADSLAIEGANYASRDRIRQIFAGDYGTSVFSIPLTERRWALLGIDWVGDASVSRAWPDRLVVRVQERTPVAFVVFGSGAMLIDADGILLEPPAQSHFSFPVLSGVRLDEPETGRRERVAAFLRFEKEMGQFAANVSEVDASDPAGLRIVAQVENRAVNLIMGDGDFARKYQNFLRNFPEIQKRSPEAKVFDLTLQDRITVKEEGQWQASHTTQ